MPEELQIRIHGEATLPTLVYLPGLHGDWTLMRRFRKEVEGQARFVEITYPRTTEWTLRAYAQAVEQALTAHGITHGWLLAESFGSQVAWELVAAGDGGARHSVRAAQRAEDCPPCPDIRVRADAASGVTKFEATGLILAGGFVKHPSPWSVRLTERIMQQANPSQIRLFLGLYAKYARLRHHNDSDAMEGVAEFIERRTPEDCAAMVHRIQLIRENNPQPIASQTRLPVYQLFGFIDPVVPGFATQRWLRRHCPGYRKTKVILPADHNVLDRAHRQSAQQVLRWLEVM